MSSDAPVAGAAPPQRRARVRGERRAPTSGPAEPGAERDGLRMPPVLRLLNVGYGNLVLVARVVAIVSPQSSPMKRLREEASSRGKLVDATQGRRTRSILVTDSDHVILSALNPETLAARLGPGAPVDAGP
jgi:regulator of extracellular matrix RemA (YlzA/DUF370 family)